MLVYNDLEPSEKLVLYDRGVRVTTEEGIHKSLVVLPDGRHVGPEAGQPRGPRSGMRAFLECVRFNKCPLSSATAGLKRRPAPWKQRRSPSRTAGRESLCESAKTASAPLTGSERSGRCFFSGRSLSPRPALRDRLALQATCPRVPIEALVADTTSWRAAASHPSRLSMPRACQNASISLRWTLSGKCVVRRSPPRWSRYR